jgi:hypothetical protein
VLTGISSKITPLSELDIFLSVISIVTSFINNNYDPSLQVKNKAILRQTKMQFPKNIHSKKELRGTTKNDFRKNC